MYKALAIDELKSVYDMFSLKGKVALVTGAGGGIGRSTAKTFAEMGANVALMDIENKREVMEANAKYMSEKFGVKVIVVTGDVSDEASVKAFMKEIVDQLGTIDVVHNNAGIGGGGIGSDVTMEEWQRVVGINLTGVLLVGREAANIMKAHGHGGSIVITSSMSGHIINKGGRGARYAPGYPATKAAVRHMAKSMAMDYVPYGIRFNSISPGIIVSGMHDGWPEEILRDAEENLIPMERCGTLDEIVGVVAFLASDLASYCTGTDILVDGGYCVW